MPASVVISFKDLDAVERVREQLELRCQALADEFPETTRFEITLAADGAGHTAHGRVTGNQTEVAGQADAGDLPLAADKLMDTLARRLRKNHDKKIFTRRREAQRESERRRSGS